MEEEAAAREDAAGLAEALEVLREAARRFPGEGLGLAFNGGKDCAVALELLREALGAAVLSDLLVVHFEEPDEFEEVRSFVEQVRVRHDLRRLERVPGPLREGLWELHRRHPLLRACVTGRRSTDPYAEREGHFTEASAGWPPLVRVAPILRWSYQQVLSFCLFQSCV